MEDLSIYLNPIQNEKGWIDDQADSSVGHFMRSYVHEFPDLAGVKLAIIGVSEGRNSQENEGTSFAPSAVRKALYPLFIHEDKLGIADLGDIKAGHTIDDTLFAVEQVTFDLIQRGIIPIYIGGADYCSLAIYKAYCKLERLTNVVSIDPIFDVSDEDGPLDSENHLSRMILQKPGFLFNFTNIGYQTYLVNPAMSSVMKKMFFDIHRLGEVKSDIREMEPVVRQADMMTVDMRSVRMSDSPGHAHPLPNGLFGNELCQLCAYAGMNERLTSISFFEYNPEFDQHKQSAQLIAQAIWCFIDGFVNRHREDIDFDSDQFTRFRVALKGDHEITFYKSGITDRWWLEVPYPPAEGNRYRRAHLVPCSYKDYETACDQEVPDRWWQTFQKLQ